MHTDFVGVYEVELHDGFSLFSLAAHFYVLTMALAPFVCQALASSGTVAPSQTNHSTMTFHQALCWMRDSKCCFVPERRSDGVLHYQLASHRAAAIGRGCRGVET